MIFKLDSSKKVCPSNICEVLICDVCDPWQIICFSFFTVTGNQHSQHPKKYKKIEKQDDGERDTEDSTVQGSKDRGMELISETV